VALLLVHAVNPHGFSWLARTDEGNIDLNRNAQPFDGGPLPVNAGYAGIHGLLLPEEWPPSRKNQQDLACYVAEAGVQAYAAAVTAGQHTHPDGLFYGGTGPAASLLNLRSILGEHAGTARTQVAWIDVHTGLGPRGHGEKIYAGKRDAAGVALARQWWGADLTVPFLGNSASADVTGYVGGLLLAPPSYRLNSARCRCRTWCRRCAAAIGCLRTLTLTTRCAGTFCRAFWTRSIAMPRTGTAWCWGKAAWPCCKHCAGWKPRADRVVRRPRNPH
jgi:hypothetical protein